ncbi:hypothetical protein BGAPBR_I0068 (plasmid) [Borreliella garinii PBr]|uniref:Uncharacterized protein n=1 Tax=Borreliella garinii PBr TaxID=498743 RepID=B8F147_BORGR|nr:hypothetical protein BGAPBR_I0068 [Borreliella garinii PBr]
MKPTLLILVRPVLYCSKSISESSEINFRLLTSYFSSNA